MYYYHDKGIHNFKRSFTQKELHDFFTVVESERDYLFFMLQYETARRINDICLIQLNDIDFANCKIAITPNKQRGARAIRLNIDISKPTMQRLALYCEEHLPDIIYCSNYIFPGRTRKKKPVTQQHMREQFNRYRALLGLDEQYILNKSGHKCPYVRTHTLRATSINHVLRETNGNFVLGMQHSAHKSLNGFLPYLEAYEQEKLKEVRKRALNAAFDQPL